MVQPPLPLIFFLFMCILIVEVNGLIWVYILLLNDQPNIAKGRRIFEALWLYDDTTDAGACYELEQERLRDAAGMEQGPGDGRESNTSLHFMHALHFFFRLFGSSFSFWAHTLEEASD